MTVRTKLYWLATVLLAADFAVAGAAALAGAPFFRDVVVHLGYPPYFPALLGAWKILGALAVLAPGRARLKEWAYAGMFFDLSAAAISHVAVGDDVSMIAPPLGILAVALASWKLRPASRTLVAPPGGAADAKAPSEYVPRPNPLGVTSASVMIASAFGAYAACAPDHPPAPRATEGTASPDEPATDPDAAAVVDFWRDAGPSRWFAKDPPFDARFRARFLALHEAAARGELAHVQETPEGALALVILLDQRYLDEGGYRG